MGLDHVVLICRDPEASLEFYSEVSVRIDESTIIDLMPGQPDGRNTDHICLVIEPTDLHELATRQELKVVQSPVQRSGARGTGWSIYVIDPDAHLVELKHYGQTADGHAPRANTV